MERKKNTLPQKACHWMAAVIISLFVLPPVHAQRQTQTINDSWKFLKGECTAAADSAFDDSKWTSIHLPHTWNTDAYTEKDYYRGTGWYRRQLTSGLERETDYPETGCCQQSSHHLYQWQKRR